MIKLSDYVAKRLKEVYKINNIFMISGGGAMHLNDSFGKYIPYICNHHEQASAIAAEGYARVNQQLAVVSVTTGPGGLNCLNGVFGQWTDSVPVLYISGQVKYSTTISSCPKLKLRQLGDQEVDIISVVKPLTKYAKMITNPNEIKYHLDKAIFEATHGRKGPVWIDIPMNIQSSMINESDLDNWIPEKSEENTKKQLFIDTSVVKIIKKINSASRPLIVAGNGIKISKQEKVFNQLVQKLNIPVVTTFNGIDILESDNKNYVGRIGTIGQRCGNFALQNADLVLFLGTRNNIRQVSYNWENFAKNAFKIIVDIDKNELQKPLVKPDIAINADLADFLPALLKNDIQTTNFKNWLNFCKKLQKKYSFENTKEYQQKKKQKINPYYFTHTLTKLLDKKDTIVAANGSACVCLYQVGITKKGQRVILNSGNASMGYDLPASIGACIANNRKKTICLAGDGSIMMNLQELQTIQNYNLPIKIFVLNNNGYISIRQTQNNFFNGRLTACSVCSGVTIPDFTKIGKSFNLKTIKINNPELLEKQINDVLKYNGPVLCEIILDSDYIFLPKLSAKKLEDGTMISPSLEDMYPFLDRKEFEENIIK
ncbi:MAG: thiamine pyrophosphate-binding protein [Endomicrobiia bacterium]